MVGWRGYILSPGLRALLASTVDKSQPTCCIKSNCLNSGNCGNRCGYARVCHRAFNQEAAHPRPINLTMEKPHKQGRDFHMGTVGISNCQSHLPWPWFCIRVFRKQMFSQTRRGYVLNPCYKVCGGHATLMTRHWHHKRWWKALEARR